MTKQTTTPANNNPNHSATSASFWRHMVVTNSLEEQADEVYIRANASTPPQAKTNAA